MKFLVSILLTAVLAFVAGLYLPWWSIAIAGFLVALMIHQRAWKAMFSGFLGGFIFWTGLASWISMKNEGILAERIASVLPLGGNTILLLIVTGFLGGLVSGLSAMSGSYLRATTR